MYKQKRKGFTLVELLVVIAILSVLATVSIIGYTQFIKKAHISNDLSLITQINRGLEAAQIGADKPATLHEARTILDDLGFDLPKLTPTTAKHNYVWNCETNRFLLISDKLEVVAPQGAKLDASKSFAVAHNEEELATWQEKGFSVYLADEFKLESGALEITKGIDVGNNNIDINYTNTSGPAQEIIIRTNGGRLTIDGYVNSTDSTNGDVITHYNNTDEVEIIKCATQSYQ